jgi:hypothetical protein
MIFYIYDIYPIESTDLKSFESSEMVEKFTITTKCVQSKTYVKGFKFWTIERRQLAGSRITIDKEKSKTEIAITFIDGFEFNDQKKRNFLTLKIYQFKPPREPRLQYIMKLDINGR